ncbi:MAG: DNA mismatch repair protein MutS [Holophagaceae bacterium]|nr:DNA mismatch repair protein MutS [Holophagaceae bacterium]
MSTPMSQQMATLKREAGSAILLTRMGDFYELQGQDAVIAAPIMEIALTTRAKGTAAETPMCGVPHHALDQYLPKLLNAGYSAAIAEPTAKAEDVKGLLPRAIKRIITPGTWLDDDSRWLAAIHRIGNLWGIALLQLASGQLIAIPGEGEESLLATTERLAPQEIIQAESAPEFGLDEISVATLPDWRFESERARQQILSYFGWQHLEGVGLDPFPATISALGALLDQVEVTQKGRPAHIQGITLDIGAVGPLLDATSAKHLEIAANAVDGSKSGTLLNLLDICKTRMGSRLIKSWLDQPLRDRQALEKRWAQVRWFTEDSRRSPLRGLLAQTPDLERLLGKVAMGLAAPPDLALLRSGLKQAQKIPPLVLNSGEAWFDAASALELWPIEISLCIELHDELEQVLADAPPLDISQGGIIRSGANKELDALASLARDAKSVMLELEDTERKKSGIQSLKIRYNRVFGYYFEITKANLASVPKHFIRKQTLVNAERFTTEQLIDFEQKLSSAETDRQQLEERLFRGLSDSVLLWRADLLALANAIAKLDALCAFAENARHSGWTEPELTSRPELNLVGGRHPMLEAQLGRGCVPNDLTIAPASPISIVTGPNMGGKSTFLRMAAILVVMAQAGSFVPAESMRFGIVDRIFTRIGASDYLSKGQSTFMVEMTETARILNQVTPLSLVILDEIGRGTSTRDGLALAEAIAHHLRDYCGGAPRTLFATHYFELTKLATHPRVNNLHVEVQEWGDQLHFLHRIAEGPADRSYGIQVARLAGLPKSVIAKARRILCDMQEQPLSQQDQVSSGTSQPLLPIFDPEPDILGQELDALDINNMTPIAVMNWVAEKQKMKRAAGSSANLGADAQSTT